MVDDYWFYLPQSIYVAVKDNVMLYDTIENRRLIIPESFMKPVFRDLLDIANMGVVRLERGLAESESFKRITELGMGVLVDTEHAPEKPVVLPCKHTVNLDYDRINDIGLSAFFIDKDLSRFLLDLSIVHDVTACSRCSRYFISQDAWHSGQDISKMPLSTLKSIMDQIQHYPLTRVRIISDCMDIGESAGIRAVIDEVTRYNKKPVICLNIDSSIMDTIVTMSEVGLELVVDSFNNPESLRERIRNIPTEDCRMRFVVRNELDYALAMEISATVEIEDYEVCPCLDGGNHAFVSDLLSPELEEIFARPVSMKEIFRNSKLNSNTFGRMTVVPIGDIHVDTFLSPFGNIGKDKILDCIQKAVSSKESWRLTRQYPRCTRCLFQYICPPPSAFDEKLDLASTCSSFTK